MENTGVHQFTLTDANGKPHDYLVTEHPGGEGMTIMFELLALGAPTVLGLAGAALKSEELLGSVIGAFKAEGESTAGDVSELARQFAALDLGSVGNELGKALAMGKAPELTRKILSRTHRDGRPLATHIDIAYQANYLELLTALWRVCSINRFFPVPSTLLGSSPAPRIETA